MYQTPAAKAATRALSLLSVSLGKSEISAPTITADEIRALPIDDFWEQIAEWIAESYGPNNWLEGIPMDMQIIAVAILPENDKYGNSFLCEMQYNVKGHRVLFGIPKEEMIRVVTKDDEDILYTPLITTKISCYMD
jgi:hypothetical protein